MDDVREGKIRGGTVGDYNHRPCRRTKRKPLPGINKGGSGARVGALGLGVGRGRGGINCCSQGGTCESPEVGEKGGEKKLPGGGERSAFCSSAGPEEKGCKRRS